MVRMGCAVEWYVYELKTTSEEEHYLFLVNGENLNEAVVFVVALN